MKTYLKTLGRMFQKHITRFISIILIVLVAVGFISGIGAAADKIKYSLNDYYREQNVSDLIVKSTSDDGFTAEQVEAARSHFGEKNVNTGVSADAYIDIDGEKQLVRIYFLEQFDDISVNKFSKPDVKINELSVFAEASDNKIKGLEDGEKITLDFIDIMTQLIKQSEGEDAELPSEFDYIKKFVETEITLTVAGTVKSPLTFANDGEPSWLNPADTPVPDTMEDVNKLITLDNILYAPYSAVPEIPEIPHFHPEAEKLMKVGDMYISFEDKGVFSSFSKNYDGYAETQKTEFLREIGSDGSDVEFITLNDNYSFKSLVSYADKVMGIGFVLIAAFLFVTTLVVLSNMTRLMEEERGQIACLRTLGYSSFKIIFKYILFAVIATLIGGVGAYFVGLGLAYLICYVFNYSFAMPPISPKGSLLFFICFSAVIFVATIIATVIAGRKMTSETPANLLRPKAPKAGKKSFLEKIPFIWNNLSFKYKSTTRNVLRYLSRFIMTVVAVAVSTALVLAGLALLDICLFGGMDSPSVMAIAIVVIIFAGLLTAVVIYTLTNINISERNRELATLKVLGYHDKEVAGYIYREVYIDTAVGVLFGFPLAIPIMLLLFWIMGMGTIGGMSWFWWLVAPAVVFLFTFLVTLLLTPKIIKIDMNESLKAIE